MIPAVLVPQPGGLELGHDVALFASGDSRTKGELHPVWPRALRLGRKGADPNAACAVLLEAIARRAKDFDVIHAHIDWLPLPLLSRLGVPFVTTMHGRLDPPGLSEVLRQFPGAGSVSISDHQRLPLPEANWIATIQHGLPKRKTDRVARSSFELHIPIPRALVRDKLRAQEALMVTICGRFSR